MRDCESDFLHGTACSRRRNDFGPDQHQLGPARPEPCRRLTLPATASVPVESTASSAPRKLGHLVDVISTRRACFFREVAHFDFLRDFGIPELLALESPDRAKGFRVWSVACSTGEEPYSIAMTLADARLTGGWRVTATDTSSRLLKQAAAGIYGREALEPLAEDLKQRHFERCSPPDEGHFRVRSALRERVEFQRASLLQGPAPRRAPFHAIFCRDVMTYFDRATQQELVGCLTRRLVPGGYLFVGHTESLADLHPSLRSIQPAVYRRQAELWPSATPRFPRP